MSGRGGDNSHPDRARALCDHCARDVALTISGVIRNHRMTRNDPGSHCPGGGYMPKEYAKLKAAR